MKMWKLLCYDIKYGCIKNLKLLLFPVIFEMAVLFMLWQKMNSYAQYGISTQKHMGDVLLYNFGGMEKYKMSMEKGNIKLYLPESFEWIILSSELLEDKEIKDIMDKPENYIESQEYFSWERFFTKLLVDKTAGTYLKYQKGKLNPTYLHEKNKNIILRNIKNSIDF